MSRAELLTRVRRPRAAADPTLRMLRVLLAFESSLYAAVTPVLPHYAHTLHASKPAVGVLAAAYAAGIIPGGLLGGWVVARAGVRRTSLAGLSVFAVAIAAFGLAGSLAALDALRVLQGAACGFIWAGGLTWAIAVTPRPQRGAVVGSVIGAAIFGTLIGPLLGVLAVSAGTGPVFGAVGLAAAALALWVAAHPDPGTPVPDTDALPPAARRRAAFRETGLWLGSWLVAFDAMTTGAISALIPLRLSARGASGLAIGATFVLASAVATIIAPIIGRSADRRGPQRAMTVGLLAGAVLCALIPVPGAWVASALLCVVVLGGPLSAFMIPAVPIMTVSAERVGFTVVLATSLVNLAYAVGETIGAPSAAVLSSAAGDGLPFAILSALMLATLVWVRRARATTAPAGAHLGDADEAGAHEPFDRASAGPPAPVRCRA